MPCCVGYARALGTTRATLMRACRAAFGKAPAEMVHDRLALKAMRYLRFTAAGVAQVSDCLGFTDPTYFARFFRNHAGMTASVFRRDHGWVAKEGA